MDRTPRPNQIYRHFKGKLYRVLTLAQDSESDALLVIYQALYGDYKVYARPLEMFVSEVDHEKYPEVKETWRFTLIPSPMDPEAIVSPLIPAAGAMEVSAAQNVEDCKQADAEPASEDSFNVSEGPHPLLLDFLDAETYERKLEIYKMMHGCITDAMLNTIAATMDVEPGVGDLEDRYLSIRVCLETRKRFEVTRLR